MQRILALTVLLLLTGSMHAQSIRVSFAIQGSCAQCSHEEIESTIWALEGVNSISYVNSGQTVSIIIDSKVLSKADLFKLLRKDGYRVNSQGTGCCSLAEAGKEEAVDVSWNGSDIPADDDDELVNDDESMKEIDNTQEEIKNMDFKEAVRSEAVKDIEESEEEFTKMAEEVATISKELEEEEEAELDADIENELTRLNESDVDDFE